MGRPLGKKTSAPKYNVSLIDCHLNNPIWIDYKCSSYGDIIKILKDNHNITLTRDVIQNITLNRNNQKSQYAFFKITKI